MVPQKEQLKQRTVAILRALGVLGAAELVTFALTWWRSRADNAAYVASRPDFARPPAYRMYEAYSYTSYRAYATSGGETAEFIEGLVRRHLPGGGLSSGPAVAEWGCGLARIIKPLRQRTGWAVTGFDYNPASIAWCRHNVPGGSFLDNGLHPPLPCADGSFDALYCISVFTHLPEDLHMAWIAEIARVLKPGGVLIASFHSKNAVDRLLDGEARQFDAGNLVVRGNVRVGGRLFAAYHPSTFIKNRLLKGFEVLEVIENPVSSMIQTVYVARFSCPSPVNPERN